MADIHLGDTEDIKAGVLLRQLPEAFWDVAVHQITFGVLFGCVDPADRKRIVAQILRLVAAENETKSMNERQAS